jgi:hypothetical protein
MSLSGLRSVLSQLTFNKTGVLIVYTLQTSPKIKLFLLLTLLPYFAVLYTEDPSLGVLTSLYPELLMLKLQSSDAFTLLFSDFSQSYTIFTQLTPTYSYSLLVDTLQFVVYTPELLTTTLLSSLPFGVDTLFMWVSNSGLDCSIYSLRSSIVSFATKFILIILLLIFVRGGIPRYRFDFLTKMGWFKYFSWVLLFYVVTYVLYVLFS